MAGEAGGLRITEVTENIMAAEFGFVYVLRNECMNGVYKVGMTSRSPHQRAAELSRGSGIPSGYDVVYYMEVEDPRIVERDVHVELAEYRVSAEREFFRCKLEIIITAIQSLGDMYSCWESDIAMEAMNPGSLFPEDPLAFESSLHELGYRLRFRHGGGK